MSSESSVNSGSLSPGVTSPGGRRRNASVSANAPNVVLTDRVRPEWANKLQTARAHLARRAAAATALHTAAFMMNNNESRALRSRFGRRNTGGSGSASATPGNGDENRGASPATPANAGATTNTDRAARDNSNRRSRLEDLEEMMFAEAIRLSLAAEEERKRKAEKEEEKAAKKREKEREKAEKKAEKAAAKAAAKQGGPYEATRSGHSSASGSSLSLPGLSFGRKRGNSAASNLRVEASVASAMASTGAAMSLPGAPGALASDANTKDKGKGVDRSAGVANDASASARPIPSPQPTPGPSHLRQMSSASSVSSSAAESNKGSYVPPSNLQDPNASGLSLGGRSGVSEDGDEQDRDPSTSSEPLFNFRSLAEVVGVSIEGEHAGKRLSQINGDGQVTEGQDENKKSGEGAGEHVEDVVDSQDTVLSEPDSEMTSQPPRFTITLDSPATSVEDVSNASDSKHVGNETTVEHARQVTQ